MAAKSSGKKSPAKKSPGGTRKKAPGGHKGKPRGDAFSHPMLLVNSESEAKTVYIGKSPWPGATAYTAPAYGFVGVDDP